MGNCYGFDVGVNADVNDVGAGVGLGVGVERNQKQKQNQYQNLDQPPKTTTPISSFRSRRGKVKHHGKSSYDLVITSPSEMTSITQAISPSSQIITPNSNTDGRDEQGFAFEEQDDGFPSDEEFENDCSFHNIDVFINRIESNAADNKNNEKLECVTDDIFCDTITIKNNENYEENFHRPCINPVGTNLHSNTQIKESFSSKEATMDYLKRGVYRKSNPTPLLAPPKSIATTMVTSSVLYPLAKQTSVNPRTISTFNKIKIQTKQAKSLQNQHRQKEKIKDRRRDIRGYRELWGEYSEIQEQINKQQEKLTTSPNVHTESISLNDSTKWYVDFASLNSLNHLDDREIKDRDILYQDNQKNQTRKSTMTQSTLIAQNKTFQKKTVHQRYDADVYSYQSESRSVASSSANGGDEQNNKAIIMNDNNSVISDLDYGNSDVEVDKNDDYGVGVLNRYRCVPIHSDLICTIEKLIESTNVDAEDAAPSTSSNIEENSLFIPSVSIENAESGIVRWRTFHQADQKNLARKINFPDIHDNIKSKEFEYKSDVGGINIYKAKGKENSSDSRKIKAIAPKQKVNALVDDSLFASISCLENGGNLKKSCEEEWDLNKCDTKNGPKPPSSNATNNNNGVLIPCEMSIEREEEGKDVKLMRKIGPQLHDLITQLKGNGLGE